ncbi:RAD51B [Symbiodinium sp. CCMP2592]|nr:RAD51B [Symbiodinium sp. CCMP2592]
MPSLSNLKDFVSVPPWELRDWLLITEEEATELLSLAWAATAAPAISAWDLAADNEAVVRPRPCPLPSLSLALGAGGLSAALVEVAGPPGVGKTQFCLHAAALIAACGHDVFWIDTERTFSAQRVHEMLEVQLSASARPQEAAAQATQAMQRIKHRACSSLQELHDFCSELAGRALRGAPLPGLLVIDSVAAVARVDGSGDRRVQIPRRQALLSSLASQLKVLVARPRQRRLQEPPGAISPGVVVTNQVMGDPSAGISRVTLGHVWHHSVNWRLVLSHLPPGSAGGPGSKEQADPFGRRYLFVEKSPCFKSMAVQQRP